MGNILIINIITKQTDANFWFFNIFLSDFSFFKKGINRNKIKLIGMNSSDQPYPPHQIYINQNKAILISSLNLNNLIIIFPTKRLIKRNVDKRIFVNK